MKKRAIKYFSIFLVLFLGVSLGNVRKENTKEVMYPVDKVESNFFMKLGHNGEVFISKSFSLVFDATGNILKTVFGM